MTRVAGVDDPDPRVAAAERLARTLIGMHVTEAALAAEAAGFAFHIMSGPMRAKLVVGRVVVVADGEIVTQAFAG